MIFHNHHYSVDEGKFPKLEFNATTIRQISTYFSIYYGRVFKLEGVLYGIIFESLLNYYLTNLKNNLISISIKNNRESNHKKWKGYAR